MQFILDRLLEAGLQQASLPRARLLVDSYWAESTQHNYHSRWSSFSSQCATVGADPWTVDATFLADWLTASTFSSGLARSFAVAVSSIRYFIESNFPSLFASLSPPQRLGEHPAVIQVLRAIDRSRGRSVARVAQVWDLKILLGWLRSSYSTLSDCSHLILRTRLLILLRVAFLFRSVDVEKLSLSSIVFTLRDGSCVLPHQLRAEHVPLLSSISVSVFDPKGAAVAGQKGTVSPPASCAVHREEALCVVRHVAAYFLRFFLPRCGSDPSGWRRTGLLLHLNSLSALRAPSFSAAMHSVFAQLQIDAKAHSLRAVVASALFDDGLSLDQIRLLGGWHSITTMENFYIRSQKAATLRLRALDSPATPPSLLPAAAAAFPLVPAASSPLASSLPPPSPLPSPLFPSPLTSFSSSSAPLPPPPSLSSFFSPP